MPQSPKPRELLSISPKGSLEKVESSPIEVDKTYIDNYRYTFWLFDIAVENDPFIDGLPITNGDFPWLC